MKPEAVEVDDCMVIILFFTNQHPETMGKHEVCAIFDIPDNGDQIQSGLKDNISITI